MAINKDSNGYTFVFAIALVVIVGAGLAAVSMGLKPMQDKNVEIKKKMDILGALNIESTRQNATELYDKHILTDECVVIGSEGQVKDGLVAFNIDIKKQYKDKNLNPKDRDYPLYVADLDGETKYVIPVVGSGLWGPIWGYFSVDSDKQTIFGAKFDHQGETPGLGAEIKQKFYYSQYEGEKITGDIKSVKDGTGAGVNGKVDGITGGTITSKGVEEMVNRTLSVYVKYFNNN
ncbi:NADH:ubiquinone reductase (Na(+)-transporting) subunit C [Paracrocinitomix mangrovi]|uniref:NADH:ubiquinone reductase (Na(+)-transporting) subunit C n=1 Tax=Paracrocinitomix mangrovi TaxID=2862509 RepID=UPI001C8DAFED|nr:NADH:ubiquinone reductase (Na(+)-transporting) subunit C [Paracrocinitomix mangrovi]UKN01370.1 NADH:ubiquinone reductase (Na(+)-transporting) subunit C [Paracrocinitomix mangrovi]